MEFMTDTFQFVLRVALRIGLVILVVLVGRKLAAIGRQRLQPILKRAKLTPSMITLAITVTYYGIWISTIMLALIVVGVPIDTVLLMVGGVLVVLGIALQQSLRDIAATVNFLLYKPFEPGDIIETNNIIGTVQEIELLNTTILRADRKLAVLPNGQIQQNGLLNYSKIGTLRADMEFSISYEDDLVRAKQIIADVLSADPRVLRDPEPLIIVLTLGDNGVTIGVRPYVRAEDSWQVQWDTTEAIKLRFDKEGITIPYPQRTLHMKQGSDNQS